MWKLYTLLLYPAYCSILLVSPFHSKARKWIRGRKNWKTRLRDAMEGIETPIWVHCSSLGEFEQGRPVIDALAAKGEKIVLSFFSPSGYEHRKNYENVQHVTYLPLDTPGNAEYFLSVVKPKAVLFVKYEFWFNFIRIIHKVDIPLFLISGIFRKNQYFFRWWGKPFAAQLKKFTHFFVQDENSAGILQSIGIGNFQISGDTRFDRVLTIKEGNTEDPLVDRFIQRDFLIVAGSTWPEDEKLLLKLATDPAFNGQIILVPHDVREERISSIVNRCTFPICVYSNGLEEGGYADLMIIDQVGLLSNLYRKAQIAYLGGGFGKGIHNILEAAVFGIPVIFGPNYEKFTEARDLVKSGGAVSVNKYLDLSQIVFRFKNDMKIRNQCGRINEDYVKSNNGATGKIIAKLQETEVISD